MLNDQEINYYLKIISCLNKIYNKKGNKIDNNNNRIIFKNIFYYIGKFRNKK